MANWQSGDVSTNGIRMHYTRTGGDKPPFVLAHGFSDDGLCWTPVATALEHEYDVIMLDARGHGLSEGPEEGYGPVDQAEDVAGAIRALGLERPAILGHSMGALTALVLSGLYPDLVGSVLLEDPPPAWNEPPPTKEQISENTNRMVEWITSLRTKTREELIEHQRAQEPNWSNAELGPWADSKLRFNFNATTFRSSRTFDQSIINNITAPTLLITADSERGAIVTPNKVEELKERIPHLRVAHIPNAGHNIRRDQFDAYLEVVRNFLKETYR